MNETKDDVVVPRSTLHHFSEVFEAAVHEHQLAGDQLILAVHSINRTLIISMVLAVLGLLVQFAILYVKYLRNKQQTKQPEKDVELQQLQVDAVSISDDT